jgi:hypothetical protein
VHSFICRAGLRHENKKYYASVKYNAGFVIATGICPPIAPQNGAACGFLVQILLINPQRPRAARVTKGGEKRPTAFRAVFCYHPATLTCHHGSDL